MKTSAASLLAFAALLTTAAADGASTWLQWSSPAPAPAPAPVTWTDWETSYSTVYKTVDNTVTVTETPKPVTVTVTATATQVSVSVSGSVATVVNTVVNTVVPPAVTVTVTSVAVSVSVVSSISTVTNTVTVTSVSRSVTTAPAPTGITTCSSRIVNPTYTTTASLPSDYLWGCPVGTICKPPQVDCNFEQNPPADSYYCSPDECVPISPLPPIEEYINQPVNSTCAFLTPIKNYFNLNPQLFQMDYNIFNIYGNPVCPIIEKVYVTVTTTVVSGTTVVVPTTIVQYSNVPTTVVRTQVDTQYSNVPVPTTLVQVSNVPVPTTVVQVSNVPVPTTVVEYSKVEVPTTVVEYETVYASSSWGAWNSKVTKRAEFEDHHLEKRANAVYNSACYPQCNYAVGVVASMHYVDALCNVGGPFSVAYDAFRSCTMANPIVNGMGNVADVSLGVAVAKCKYPMKRTAAPEPSAAGFRFARG